MTFATHYSRAGRRANAAKRLNTAAVLLVVVLKAGFCSAAFAGEGSGQVGAAFAEGEFQSWQQAYQANHANSTNAWQFARACFDWAEFSTNDTQRAALAQLGIKACRALLKRDTNSVAGHYYLGMNLGQLARTKNLGALPIVDEMEMEFKAARRLDQNFDQAGPDRNLGLLYLEAPSIGSIGSRSKARTHLLRAVELAPDFPENRLNLAEALVRWRDSTGARQQLDALEAGLGKARTQYDGPAWAAAWNDWERRLAKLRAQLLRPIKPATSPKGTP